MDEIKKDSKDMLLSGKSIHDTIMDLTKKYPTETYESLTPIVNEIYRSIKGM